MRELLTPHPTTTDDQLRAREGQLCVTIPLKEMELKKLKEELARTRNYIAINTLREIFTYDKKINVVC